ncbi:type II toxin-antitoxin system RelB family antitoxin [Brevibacterium yomogidense]|uniref:type II toxin-antitoxin system RelB family antitoxin n=1 Tax=Brevibacterium yomogidense TaxID=946573 RepID=UPI0018DF6418|nr:ribbon-helix-helix protein, CopG family [Brevibacterium yomogidense]
MSTSEVLSIRLPNEMKARLGALSETTGRPAAYYVRQAISERIDDLEWAYGVAAHAEAIRSGTSGSRLLDDLASELGFDPNELRDDARSFGDE